MNQVASGAAHSVVAPLRPGAMLIGVVVSIVAANVWLLLLFTAHVPIALFLECVFLVAFLGWAKGGGPPQALKLVRRQAFRSVHLTPAQWAWGLLAAFFFAVTVHAALVVLFRLIPYPVAAFRHGYDLSFLASRVAQWSVVIVSAASAAICEEVCFRGFLQRPLEARYGVALAVTVSSLAFMALHLSKSWALAAMIPIVFAAGVLLGLLAHAATSLLPGMIGHCIMDVGLFAYWWTGIAGTFVARPISETGIDLSFLAAGCVFAGAIALVILGIRKLRSIAGAIDSRPA